MMLMADNAVNHVGLVQASLSEGEPAAQLIISTVI